MAKGNIRALVEVGILLASVSLGAADVQAKKPLPSIFPPIDPSRVDCTAFRTGNEGQCYRTANEVYQLNLLILSEYEAGDFAGAGQDVLPNTPTMFPDGTVIYGVGPENFPVIAAFVGSNDFAFMSIDDEFRARVLDNDTVVLFGNIDFTVLDDEHGGTVRIIRDAQTELFRRNPQMPRGWDWCTSRSGTLRHCVESSSAHHCFSGCLGLGNVTAYALSDQYLQPYYAEHRASVLRQTLEEHRYVCDTEFVTEPPTPFRYFQWRQATYEWAIKAAGIRAFAWCRSEVEPDDIARPGRRIGAMSTPMAA